MRHTEETKRKLSEMRSGERNPFFGKRHTPETLAKIAARRLKFDGVRRYSLRDQLITVPGQIDAAYLAGMIDADGSVRFKKGKPFVTVYNTSRPLIDWLIVTIGHGCITNGLMGREQVLAWTIQGARDVYALLTAIRPYMIVKAADADAAFEFYKEKYGWAIPPR